MISTLQWTPFLCQWNLWAFQFLRTPNLALGTLVRFGCRSQVMCGLPGWGRCARYGTEDEDALGSVVPSQDQWSLMITCMLYAPSHHVHMRICMQCMYAAMHMASCAYDLYICVQHSHDMYHIMCVLLSIYTNLHHIVL